MPKFTSIALAALFSSANALEGCYPAYGSGATFYMPGSKVSYTRSVTTTENCGTSTTGGCVNGKRQVTSSVKENYECTSNDWCNDSGRQPGTVHEGTAWTRRSECDNSITPPPIIPDEWDEGGCPDAYAAGADYSEGDAVSVNFGSYKMVYTCVSGDYSAFCGTSGYEPGTSVHWNMAWTEQGSCTGSLSPTTSPVFDALEDQGGCPEEYATGTDYEEMDKVEVDGFVYQCKKYPASGWCGNDGYVPGDDASVHWPDAWTLLGYCSGTITPTTSPNFDALEDLGACPKEWMENNDGEAYEEGDRIAVGELVFQCKGWPMGLHCNQPGYVPNDGDASTAGAWKDAWILAGYCNGSMGPTESPSFDPDGSIGACPDEWVSGGGEDGYDEGDMVSVVISVEPERKVAYRCKAWPYNGHCGQYSPTEFGGDQGWTYAGSCDGSMGPTMSPVFESLKEVGDGCPPEYDSSVDYEAGDQVAVVVSESAATDDALERTLVYECKNYPESGYCANQASNMAPGEDFGNLGWKLKGYCEGTTSPTSSPTEYSGTPYFIKCNEPTTCAPGSIKAYDEAPGSTNCSCGANADSGSHCKRTICEYVEVMPYSSSTTYDAGDVVRIGNRRYKCKGQFFTGWCSVDTYEPTVEVNELWPQAWTRDGDAPQEPTNGNGSFNPIGAPCDTTANRATDLECSSGKCECTGTTCCTVDAHCTVSGETCGGGAIAFNCG